MRRVALIAALALAVPLASCGANSGTSPGALPTPVAVADRTKVDEQAGITVTLAYTAAARAAALAIDAGLVKDPAKVARIGQLDNQAYAAVQAVRTAYSAANAADYATAIARANAAVSALTAASKGQ